MKTRRMNRWDSMLAWLSTGPQHKWQNVKSACGKLSAIEFPDRQWTPLRHAMYWAGTLIRLGHAEFDADSHSVVATRPGVVILPSENRALLYGYWSPTLRRRLVSELGSTELKLWRCIPDRGPTCHVITAREEQLTDAANSLNVWSSRDCSLNLLRRLPLLSHVLDGLQPSRFSVVGYWERFDYRSNLYGRWQSCDDPLTKPGLYQRKEGQTVQVFVTNDGGQFGLKSQDEKLAAKWSRYSPRFDWRFDALRSTLLIPDGTPELPLLVSRGLTLRSARLPKRVTQDGRRWWKYDAVGQRQAEEAARIMEQPLA